TRGVSHLATQDLAATPRPLDYLRTVARARTRGVSHLATQDLAATPIRLRRSSRPLRRRGHSRKHQIHKMKIVRSSSRLCLTPRHIAFNVVERICREQFAALNINSRRHTGIP